ncbi:amidohydrolase family protein [Candidatus Pacearchaeota archaeon]|nr:amidohydrolase family protein [Candidatus Pacearchaeota archaeon]
MSTLIKNTTAYIGKNFERYNNVDILIEKDNISKIGKGIISKDSKTVNGRDFFVTPGFINAHFHASQQLNRALGVGLNHDQQMDLLHATDNIKKDTDKYWMSYIAILEGLKAGTTCFYSVGSEIETAVKAYNNMGVRAACAIISKDIVAENKKSSVRAKTWETQERLDFAEKIHNKHHSDLVRVYFGAVNVRYCSDKLILGMQKLAEKYNVGFHMHAAEGDDYVNHVKERTGRRPIEHLHKIGALNPRVSLAHMTKLTSEEIDYLSKSGAHVVHCPRANSYVSVGICPTKKLIDASVNVALGSDAAINNNSNEVRGEARAAYDRMSDISGKANIIDYIKLFQMLTINGAKAMGLEKKIGTIEEGKKADLVMWNKNDLPFIPGFNHLADLIFTETGKAHTVYIDGKVVLKDYRLVTMDEQKLKSKATAISERYYKVFKNSIEKHLK